MQAEVERLFGFEKSGLGNLLNKIPTQYLYLTVFNFFLIVFYYWTVTP